MNFYLLRSDQRGETEKYYTIPDGRFLCTNNSVHCYLDFHSAKVYSSRNSVCTWLGPRYTVIFYILLFLSSPILIHVSEMLLSVQLAALFFVAFSNSLLYLSLQLSLLSLPLSICPSLHLSSCSHELLILILVLGLEFFRCADPSSTHCVLSRK